MIPTLWGLEAVSKALCALLAAAIALNTVAHVKARAADAIKIGITEIERPGPRSVATRPIWLMTESREVIQHQPLR
jgi:hypothetical protein